MGTTAYELRVTLDPPCNALRVGIRAYIDPDSSALDGEFEVQMEPIRTSAWVGRFNLDGSDATWPYYRIGLMAPQGTPWIICIRELSTGRVLIRDSDQMDAGKTWLLGSWEREERYQAREPLPHSAELVIV